MDCLSCMLVRVCVCSLVCPRAFSRVCRNASIFFFFFLHASVHSNLLCVVVRLCMSVSAWLTICVLVCVRAAVRLRVSARLCVFTQKCVFICLFVRGCFFACVCLCMFLIGLV